MPTPSSTGELLDLVRKSGLVRADALDAQLRDPAALPGDAAQAAAVLVREGLLTPFQAKLLLAGRYRGFRVGPYLIREQIGRGGMGAVYLAEHETLRRRVAVKVLTEAGGGKLAVERFLREARAAAALDHPNIVRVFDVAKHGDTHYLAMEYVDGRTLDAVVEKGGPVPCGLAVGYVMQVAAGLQHAYEKGFVHRDIKPANLILGQDGTVKILDMGLARSFDAGDKLTEVMDAGAVLGTADYISPEQAMNSPDLDTRADIYSLGATFFALVTGSPPFSGNTTQKLMQHQMKMPPSLTTIDRTFPAGLAAVLARMLAKKPADRYQTPADVIAALAPWVPDGASAKVVAGLSNTDAGSSAELQNTLGEIAVNGTKRMTRRLAAPARRRRWPWVVGPAAAAFLAAAGAGTWLLTRDPAPDARPVAGPAPAVAAAPAAVPDKSPGVAPSVRPTPPPVRPVAVAAPPPAAGDQVLYRLDLSAQKPFVMAGGSEATGDPAEDVRFVPAKKTGAGVPPAGWRVAAWDHAAETELLAEERDGRMAFGCRNRKLGPKSPAVCTAMLFTPQMEVSVGRCTVRFEYRTESPDGRPALLKFKPNRPVKFAWDVEPLAGTGGQWVTVDRTVDLQGATAGFFELHHFDPDPSHALLVRSFEVTAPAPASDPPAGDGRVLYRLDLSAQKPFVTTGGSERTGDPSEDVRFVRAEKTGAGDLPPGWRGTPWGKDTVAEYVAEVKDRRPALGLHNAVKGQGCAMLFTPRTAVPGGRCGVRVEYRTDPGTTGARLRFKQTGPAAKDAWDVKSLDPTDGAWQEYRTDLDLKGATDGYFEFHNYDPDPANGVWVRAFELTGPADGAAPPAPAAAGKTVFRLAAADVPAFRCRKKGFEKTAGMADEMPKGVYFAAWKPDGLGEYFCEDDGGAKALGWANLDDLKTGQIGIDLEGPNAAGPPLTAGRRYRLRITYKTAAAAAGRAYLQDRATFAGVDRGDLDLPATGGGWRTAELAWTRPAGEVRLCVDNSATGAGNVLYVREVTVAEVAADPAAVAPAAAGPAGDPPVFALDLSAVRPFRYKFRNGAEVDGPAADPLPAGVRGQCWKKESVAEFRGEEKDGRPALGLTNLNSSPTAEYTFGPEADLRPGREYVVRVEYRSDDEAEGRVLVQNDKTFADVAQEKLPPTGGGWRTAEARFRQGDGRVRVVFANDAIGEGNTLWLRKLEVVEVE